MPGNLVLDALGRFTGMDREKLLPMLMEIATIQQDCLPVNDPMMRLTC
jgi:hypothetical protein